MMTRNFFQARLVSKSFACVALLLMYLINLSECIVEEEPVVSPRPVVMPARGGGGGGGGGGATYVPGMPINTLGQGDKTYYCDLTSLTVNNAEYEKKCGPHSDPKWPCFTHYRNSFGHQQGDLSYVRVEPWLAPLNMTEELVLRDNYAIGK